MAGEALKSSINRDKKVGNGLAVDNEKSDDEYHIDEDEIRESQSIDHLGSNRMS
jgi:hypothetical protein